MTIQMSFNYTFQEKLGKGSFGEVFQAFNNKTFEKVAIKVEPANSKLPQLHREAKFYSMLKNGKGIPNIYWYGQVGPNNVLIMDLLGPSVGQIFNQALKKFPEKNTILVIIQMIERIEFIHRKNLIHRDIKPENFLVGRGGNEGILYIVDFGLARRFREFTTGNHIPYKTQKNLTGTAKYVSINTHLGVEQSRRDDLESLSYVMMYLLKGNLPWDCSREKDKKRKYQIIKEIKLSMSLELLTKGLAPEYLEFCKYCHNLTFEEKPDYEYLLALLKKRLCQIENDKGDCCELNYLNFFNDENKNQRIQEFDYAYNQIKSRLKDNNNSEVEIFPFKSSFQYVNGELNHEISKLWL